MLSGKKLGAKLLNCAKLFIRSIGLSVRFYTVVALSKIYECLGDVFVFMKVYHVAHWLYQKGLVLCRNEKARLRDLENHR